MTTPCDSSATLNAEPEGGAKAYSRSTSAPARYDRPGMPGTFVATKSTDLSIAPNTDVVTPTGSTLPLRVVDGVKVGHLVAGPLEHEIAPGLKSEVWGYNAMPSTRTVDVHVAWLRQKIEPNPKHPQYLLTVHGLGYRFVG